MTFTEASILIAAIFLGLALGPVAAYLIDRWWQGSAKEAVIVKRELEPIGEGRYRWVRRYFRDNDVELVEVTDPEEIARLEKNYH